MYVFVSSFSGFCASVGYLRSLLIQTKELPLGVVVSGMKIGPEARARS
jgi:hypothetical protein